MGSDVLPYLCLLLRRRHSLANVQRLQCLLHIKKVIWVETGPIRQVTPPLYCRFMCWRPKLCRITFFQLMYFVYSGYKIANNFSGHPAARIRISIKNLPYKLSSKSNKKSQVSTSREPQTGNRYLHTNT